VAGAFLPRTTITYLTERDAWAAIANSERTPNAKVILGSDQLVCAEVQTKELRKIMTRKPIPCRGIFLWDRFLRHDCAFSDRRILDYGLGDGEPLIGPAKARSGLPSGICRNPI
jgi:hypothetical protein